MPAVSEAQRKAMFAARAGHSNLGIPQKVGAEFAAADPGGKLPARAKDMAPSKWAMLKKLFAEWLTEEEAEPEHAGDAEPPKDRASSVAFVTPEGKVLFLKRGDAEENYPATWAWPGGKADGDETPEACALRECTEELGDACPSLEGMRNIDSKRTPFGWDHTTFTVPVKDEFEPKLNAEHSAFKWAHPDEPPEPLHPGVKATLDTLMAKVAEDMAALATAPNSGFRLGRRRREGEDATLPTVLFAGKKMTRDELITTARKARLQGRGDIARRAEDALAKEWSQATDMALDRALAADKRQYDADGRLHVDQANISKAAVNEYLGREINSVMKDEPGWKMLEPERRYKLLRHPEEIKKAVGTFNGLPILWIHKPASAQDHPHEITIGATGNDATFDHPYLKNSLSIWPAYASGAIEDGDQKQLSAGYAYKADMTPGEFEGEKYDGVMRDLVGNHLALVREGRAGSDVAVDEDADAKVWRNIEHALLVMGAPSEVHAP